MAGDGTIEFDGSALDVELYYQTGETSSMFHKEYPGWRMLKMGVAFIKVTFYLLTHAGQLA